MPLITLESVMENDLLDEDVVINDVALFEKGTVLTRQRIEILHALGVTMVFVADRDAVQDEMTRRVLDTIEARFSAVADDAHMMRLKGWIREIVIELEGGQ